MQNKRVLRAGAAGALGVSLCICGGTQAAPTKTEGTGLRASSKQRTDLEIQPLNADQMQAAKALGLTTTPQITPWQQITVRAGDTLSGLFARAGLGGSQWRALLAQRRRDHPHRAGSGRGWPRFGAQAGRRGRPGRPLSAL